MSDLTFGPNPDEEITPQIEYLEATMKEEFDKQKNKQKLYTREEMFEARYESYKQGYGADGMLMSKEEYQEWFDKKFPI